MPKNRVFGRSGGVLRRCIKSILKQSEKRINLILVDDGSTDGSGGICDEFSDKDSRVHVIHQKNSGSVAARRNGVLCNIAQSSEYITFVDADDILPQDALKRLKAGMNTDKVDLVCGRIKRKWKNLSISSKYTQPCFENAPKVYDNEEIIGELYIGCFGITNFPVNLYAKLYKTELITQAVIAPTIVKFMGDDLSVTLNVLPKCNSLVIIPDIVYYYSLGGNTSRYMPYMLSDFLSLYQYKQKMAKLYPMPFDVERLMNIELMNIVESYLYMCARSGKFSKTHLLDEIKIICNNELIMNSAKSVQQKDIARWIIEKNYLLIVEKVWENMRKNRLKDIMKKILLSI